MIQRTLKLAWVSFTVVMLLPAGHAHADAIDGHWCHSDAGRMEIRGPAIVTPGGTQMEGLYGRHSFSYVVPASEPAAGANVDMILIDDDTVHLTRGPSTSAQTPQVWHRCPAPVS
ncbi:MAG: hypothetical protein OER92_11960 [Alphaproteobacteria bacterium]|nr:hypothetical protein [Alphaproteobacteria bacterium]